MSIISDVARLLFLDLNRDKDRHYGIEWSRRMLRRRKIVNGNNNNDDDAANEEEENEASTTTLESSSSTDTNRRCWVCFAAEDDEDAPDDEWLHPCVCKRSMKWVHNMCLNRWVDEKQNGNAFLPVKCPFCLTPYEFEYPERSAVFMPISALENGVIWATNNVPAFVVLRFGSSIFEIQYFAPQLHFVQKVVIGVFMELILPVPWTIMLLMDLRVKEWEMTIIKATVDENVLIPGQGRTMDVIGALDLGDFIRVRILPSLAILSGEAIFGHKIESLPLRALAGGLAFALARAFVRIPYRRNQYQMASSRRVKNREIQDVEA